MTLKQKRLRAKEINDSIQYWVEFFKSINPDCKKDSKEQINHVKKLK